MIRWYPGEPHVYTVNMKDLSQVEDVLKEIALKEKPEPFVPHEFSFAGYLEVTRQLIVSISSMFAFLDNTNTLD